MYNIRNFSIIAHIDHGKSTLADRFIQICGGLNQHEMSNRVLDSMDLERERGITIKAQSVMLKYKTLNNKSYQLNFIDTPGHVDFSYEVSRSLLACEGVLLIIDAGQGIEAQTIANCHKAMKMSLKIVPILNKIDLPYIDKDRIVYEIEEMIGIDANDIVCCSAKTGYGVIEVLERLIRDIPFPSGDPNGPLQALIIDSWFDNYLGVVSLIRIKNGFLKENDKIQVMSTQQIYTVSQLGIFTPKRVNKKILNCGEVGWIVCSIKDVRAALVGDTLTLEKNPSSIALIGLKKVRPQVYAGIFPSNSNEYGSLREALSKLSLNDASLFYEKENSSILGYGFRCGFLGLLHMEIVKERLEREYDLSLIISTPTVIYEVLTINKHTLYIENPQKLPSLNKIIEIREPIAFCKIMSPKKYLGRIITLCIKKRGIQTNISYFNNEQITISYEIPMAEIILNFFNELKSISNGYASLDYKFKYFKLSDIVCINVLINHEKIDALGSMSHRDNAIYRSRKLVSRIHEIIPRQQFDIIIQASINNKIVARSSVKQLRKNVLEKCYGGDVSRKKKLLQKQKDGKKRMKQIGNIVLTQEVFLAILYIEQDKKRIF